MHLIHKENLDNLAYGSYSINIRWTEGWYSLCSFTLINFLGIYSLQWTDPILLIPSAFALGICPQNFPLIYSIYASLSTVLISRLQAILPLCLGETLLCLALDYSLQCPAVFDFLLCMHSYDSSEFLISSMMPSANTLVLAVMFLYNYWDTTISQIYLIVYDFTCFS